MFGRAPETGAADQYTTSETPSRSFDTAPGYESSGLSAGQTDEVHLSGDYRSGIDNRDVLQVPTPDDPSAPPSWAVLRGSNEPDVSMSQLGASAMSEEPASAAPPEALPDSVAQPSFLADPPLRSHPATAVDPERITRWITLLKADDPALFKLWSLELQGQPDALPTILSALTDDPVLLQFADDAEYQQALVLAIGLVADSPASEQQFVAPSAPSAPAAEAAPAPEPLPEEPPPDWLRLRRAWKDDGGEA
jgi:hypothetical protein